jgi:hypothetical protein
MSPNECRRVSGLIADVHPTSHLDDLRSPCVRMLGLGSVTCPVPLGGRAAEAVLVNASQTVEWGAQMHDGDARRARLHRDGSCQYPRLLGETGASRLRQLAGSQRGFRGRGGARNPLVPLAKSLARALGCEFASRLNGCTTTRRCRRLMQTQ